MSFFALFILTVLPLNIWNNINWFKYYYNIVNNFWCWFIFFYSHSVRCGHSTLIQCTNICGNVLNCGKHNCTQICHSEKCQPCDLTVKQGEQILRICINNTNVYRNCWWARTKSSRITCSSRAQEIFLSPASRNSRFRCRLALFLPVAEAIMNSWMRMPWNVNAFRASETLRVAGTGYSKVLPDRDGVVLFLPTPARQGQNLHSYKLVVMIFF